MRRILDAQTDTAGLIIVALAGFGVALSTATIVHPGNQLSLGSVVLLCAILGPVGSVVGMYLGAEIFKRCGRPLGGKATSQELRSVIAWSALPIAGLLPTWISELLLIGRPLFTAGIQDWVGIPSLFNLSIGLTGLRMAGDLYGIVLFVACLAEAQRLSLPKALLNSLAGGLLVVPIQFALILSLQRLFA